MEIISEKIVSCETIKVKYDKGEDYFKDIEMRKKAGWKVARKPPSDLSYREEVIKMGSDGKCVLTFIRYGRVPIE